MFFQTEPLSTLLRLQRDHHLYEITQGVATLYPGLCAFALCLSFAFPLPFLSAGDLWFSRRPLVQRDNYRHELQN